MNLKKLIDEGGEIGEAASKVLAEWMRGHARDAATLLLMRGLDCSAAVMTVIDDAGLMEPFARENGYQIEASLHLYGMPMRMIDPQVLQYFAESVGLEPISDFIDEPVPGSSMRLVVYTPTLLICEACAPAIMSKGGSV